VRIIVRGMGYPLTINFAVSETFRSRYMGQHLSDELRDLVTMTFDFGGHGATRDAALHAPIVELCSKFEVGRPSNSADMKHSRFQN